MKKNYSTPTIELIGGISATTAALGSSARTDFSEFPGVLASSGSFDICDTNSNNNQSGSNCR